MKAFRLVAPGKTELVEIPRPEPGDDEVLIRVQAAGVCHSDSPTSLSLRIAAVAMKR